MVEVVVVTNPVEGVLVVTMPGTPVVGTPVGSPGPAVGGAVTVTVAQEQWVETP